MEKLMTLGEVTLSYQTAYSPEHYRYIYSAEGAYIEAKAWFPEETIELKEMMIVLLLNQANAVIGVYKLSEGGINATTLDMGLLIRAAVALPTKGIILAHNHPTGSLKPSKADIRLTQKVKDALELVDMTLLDHIIITKSNYSSICMDVGI